MPIDNERMIRVVFNDTPHTIRVTYADPNATRATADTSKADVIDLTDRAITGASGSFDSLVASVKKIVAGAKSLDDVPKLLRSAFNDLDASELETILRRSSFVAHMRGRESVKR